MNKAEELAQKAKIYTVCIKLYMKDIVPSEATEVLFDMAKKVKK